MTRQRDRETIEDVSITPKTEEVVKALIVQQFERLDREDKLALLGKLAKSVGRVVTHWSRLG